MPDKIQKYLRAVDSADEYSAKLLEDLEQKRLEDIDYLLTEENDRDPDLWNEFEADDQSMVQDFEQEQIEDRDLEWVIGLAGIAAASYVQFFLDNREETLIKPLAYKEQVLEEFELNRTELVIAGKRSVELAPVTQFQRLQTKYLDEISFLRNMDNTELYTTLREYGAIKPYQQHLSDSMQYVTRMTDYPPRSPQFKAAVNDLVDANSKRGITGMNRRAVERVYSYRESGGNPNTLMVWIGEAGANTCEFCIPRFGEVKTYGEWMQEGLPGAEVCKGGDYCRCHLAAV